MDKKFRYHAKDASGEYKKGTIKAATRDDAIIKLNKEGLFLISIEMIETEEKKSEISPEEKKRIYEEEKFRLEAQEKVKTEAAVEKAITFFVGLVIIAAVWIFVFIGTSSEKPPAKPASTTIQPTSENIRCDMCEKRLSAKERLLYYNPTIGKGWCEKCYKGTQKMLRDAGY